MTGKPVRLNVILTLEFPTGIVQCVVSILKMLGEGGGGTKLNALKVSRWQLGLEG